MIRNAADDWRRRFEVFTDSGEIRVYPLAEGGIGQKRLSVLSRENDMDIDLDEGLRHVVGRPWFGVVKGMHGNRSKPRRGLTLS